MAAWLKTTAIAVVTLGAGAGAAQAPAPFAGQTYDAVAATRGQTAYLETCAACHGADLGAGEFGPALSGAEFASHWRGQDAAAFLTYIQTKMPPASPGSLSTSTYAAIAAHILKGNGASAGAAVAAAPAQAAAPAPAG
ncbi:MAG: hypothetical protein B7Y99_05010, partial [Caulobacterales bacterium 32-69-10]